MKKKKAELGKGGKFLIKKEWRDPEGNFLCANEIKKKMDSYCF